MREMTNVAKVRKFMRYLGAEARGKGRIYLVGGSSAVLLGWRMTTMDIDLKLAPEPAGVFEAIARAKNALNINVENWRHPTSLSPLFPTGRRAVRSSSGAGRSIFFHYDFYAQALAKIERGHDQDLRDVEAMRRERLIDPTRLTALFTAIARDLVRYPAIDAASFREKVQKAARAMEVR